MATRSHSPAPALRPQSDIEDHLRLRTLNAGLPEAQQRLNEAIWADWLAGKDTYRIAVMNMVDEAYVANLLARIRGQPSIVTAASSLVEAQVKTAKRR